MVEVRWVVVVVVVGGRVVVVMGKVAVVVVAVVVVLVVGATLVGVAEVVVSRTLVCLSSTSFLPVSAGSDVMELGAVWVVVVVVVRAG